MKPGLARTLVHLLDANAATTTAPSEPEAPSTQALEVQATAEALEALFALVAKGSIEAAYSAGRLLARGVTLYGSSAPFAAEFQVGERGSEALVALASRAGSVEFLRDEEGTRVCRVRFPQPSGTLLPEERKSVALVLTALRERRNARVWVAGRALPSTLARDVWSALLGPRYGVAW